MTSPQITDEGVVWDEESLVRLRQSYLNSRNQAQKKVSDAQRQIDKIDNMIERVRAGERIVVPLPKRRRR